MAFTKVNVSMINNLPEADTTSLEQSISTLGLHMAVSDNKASFNLTDSFIDQFEDTNGISSTTDVTLDAESYKTMIPYNYHVADSNTSMLIQARDVASGSQVFTDYSGNNLATSHIGGPAWSNDKSKFESSSTSLKLTNGNIRVGFLSGNSSDWSNSHSALHLDGDWTMEYWVWAPSSNISSSRIISVHPNNQGSKQIAMRPVSSTGGGQCYVDYGSGGSYGGDISPDQISVDDWVHVATVKESTYCRNYINGQQVNSFNIISPSSQFPRTTWVIGQDGMMNSEAAANPTYVDDIRVSNINRYPSGTNFAASLQSVSNATGSIESIASTADDTVSSLSGVILYEDSAGTATLGTDLVISFSADNGSNWTPASSYGTPVTFAGSVKVVKIGKTTISNTGTEVKIKAEWANQSTNKITQLSGWAVNY